MCSREAGVLERDSCREERCAGGRLACWREVSSVLPGELPAGGTACAMLMDQSKKIDNYSYINPLMSSLI